jgi:hypothetical protein
MRFMSSALSGSDIEIILEEQLAARCLFPCKPGEKIAGQRKPIRTPLKATYLDRR